MNDRLGETRPVAVTLGEGVNALVPHRLEECRFDGLVDSGVEIGDRDTPHFACKSQKSLHRHV